MTFSLRPYQKACIDKLWDHIRTKDTNPVCVLPTGSGKSAIQAQLAKDVISWGGKILFLSHVKELIQQVADHISKIAPELPIGIYSAGLNSRDLGYPITVAGIQSAVNAVKDFGSIDIICIDEAHLLPEDGEGMYRTLLTALREINPAVRLIGMTATPFRLSSGLICKPENLLNEICYSVGIRELIRDGYLSPLRSKAGLAEPDLSKVHVRGGEFIADELEAAMNDEMKVALTVGEILELTKERKSVLVFASGVAHGNRIASMLRCETDSAGEIYGDTPYGERDSLIRRFREGTLKYLVNVNVLTTGFDAPGVDAVVMLRPTLSPGLYYQQVGRGFRIAEGKKDALILDYSGNVLRHGPVDQVIPPGNKNGQGQGQGRAPAKMCPDCRALIHAGYGVCPECGTAFPAAEVKHGIRADGTEILSKDGPEEYAVDKVSYWKHEKKNAPDGHPPTLWVEYDCGLARASEWICFEHSGFAKTKALQWWKRRSSEPFPSSVKAALESIAAHGILEPGKITLQAKGKYLRVVGASEWKPRAPAESLPPSSLDIASEETLDIASEKTLTLQENELEF